MRKKSAFSKDTWHSKGLGKSMEGRSPCDLPGSNVGIYKSQFIKEFPKLQEKKRKKKEERFSDLAENQHALQYTNILRNLLVTLEFLLVYQKP